jgi:hypothetical protein
MTATLSVTGGSEDAHAVIPVAMAVRDGRRAPSRDVRRAAVAPVNGTVVVTIRDRLATIRDNDLPPTPRLVGSQAIAMPSRIVRRNKQNKP